MKQRHRVNPGDQHAVERARRRDRVGALVRCDQRGDHGVHRGTFDPHVVAAAVLVGGGGAPVERLLVSGRERLVPAALDHVEIKGDAAHLELHGVDRAHPHRNPRPLEVAREQERETLLVGALGPGRHHDFESERPAACALDELGPPQLVAGGGKQRERAPQHGAVAATAVADRRRPGAGEHVGAHGARIWRQQRAFARIGRPPARRQFGTLEIAGGAPIEIEEQVVIGPFEIEQQRDRLAHAHVGKYRPAGVEHEELAAFGQAGRERFLDDAALAQRREVVGGLPAARIGLGAQIEQTALERLVIGVGVAVVVEADFVEIPEPAVDRQIAPPIVGIAHERKAAPGLDLPDAVRPAADRGGERGILKSVGVDRVPGQHRHQSEDQRQLAVAGTCEVEPHGSLADRLGLGDLAVIGAVVGSAFVAQQLPGEDHVRRRHRRAVREARGGIERKGRVAARRVGLDRLGKKAVEREWLVVAARHQAFDHRARDDVDAADQGRAQALGGQALDDERIEVVEGAEHALHQAAPLRRRGIDVGQVVEPGGECRLAVHGNGVARFAGAGRANGGEARKQGQADDVKTKPGGRTADASSARAATGFGRSGPAGSGFGQCRHGFGSTEDRIPADEPDQWGKVGPFTKLSKVSRRGYHQVRESLLRLYWPRDFSYYSDSSRHAPAVFGADTRR